MNPRKQNFLNAVLNAFNGLYIFFKKERNGQIQFVVAVGVIITGFYFQINSIQWLVILLCVAVVISLEIINSALEKLSDMLEPNYNLSIKIIKDMAAAAVLWAALLSVIIGLIIFIPKIIAEIGHFFTQKHYA